MAPFFGGMISFVKDNEGYIERGEMARINVNESKMAINKQFVYKCLLTHRTHSSDNKRILKWLEKGTGSY